MMEIEDDHWMNLEQSGDSNTWVKPPGNHIQPVPLPSNHLPEQITKSSPT